ncbi:MAG: molybdopterin-dependent oxidoreductase [Armatimonadota bacterium]|nr:molybdopterin-dependent oxidoreductase [Armatimonadota bacterium]
MTEAVGGLEDVSSRDPSAVGVLLAPHLTNEEAFSAQAFAREVLGTPHIDGLSAITDAAALWGIEQGFGQPYAGDDLEHLRAADVILCLNSNIQFLHPRAAAAVIRGVERGADLLLLDEVDQGMETWAAVWARHLPGGRPAALRWLCDRGQGPGSTDQAHTALTSPQAAEELRARLHSSEAVAIVLSSAAIRSAEAAAMVARVAGQVGGDASRAAGLYVFPSGSNAFGVTDMLRAGAGGGTGAGHSAGAMLSETSELRALVVVGDDLSRWIGPDRLSQVRERLETLVAISSFTSPTTELADVVLPMAAVGEKEGSIRTVDGRVWWNQGAVEPPGEARPLNEVLGLLGSRLCEMTRWESLEAIWEELEREVPAYANIGLSRLRSGEPGEVRTLASPDRERRTHPPEPAPPAAEPEPDRPFLLVTRHDEGSWTADPRCQASELLRREAKAHRQPYCLVAPEYLAQLRIERGHRVRVSTAHGEIELAARVSEGVPAPVVVLPSRFAELAHVALGADEVDPRHGGVEARLEPAAIESVAADQ